MFKRSGIYWDQLKSAPAELVLNAFSGFINPTVSTAVSMRMPVPAKPHLMVKELAKPTDDTEASTILPVTAKAEILRKRRILSMLHGNPRPQKRIVSELLGDQTSGYGSAALLGIAALTGSLLAGKGWKDTLKNTAIGTGAGLGLGITSNLLGSGIAGLTPTRTAAAQSRYEKSPLWINWVVPGMANYNYYKSMGRIHVLQAAHEDTSIKV